MSNLDETKLGELLKAMAKTNTGAIPDSMIYWTAGSHPMPWANVSSNTWEIEVNFDD